MEEADAGVVRGHSFLMHSMQDSPCSHEAQHFLQMHFLSGSHTADVGSGQRCGFDVIQLTWGLAIMKRSLFMKHSGKLGTRSRCLTKRPGPDERMDQDDSNDVR